jgi:hypothetical protein
LQLRKWGESDVKEIGTLKKSFRIEEADSGGNCEGKGSAVGGVESLRGEEILGRKKRGGGKREELENGKDGDEGIVCFGES